MNNKKLEDYGDILNPKDLHEILGIGYNKTYSLLKSGEIKSFRVGRGIKIPKSCLQEYIQNMTTQH